ncbi:MAG: hypothetical protein GY763_08270 [Gammaproteobacteria bacterium]|nr:hypothetical protein [Gammaproteobacteria bacterium]
MAIYLNSTNFPADSGTESQTLEDDLNSLLENDYHGNFFETLGCYQRILADNCQRGRWAEINSKLETLFKCGTSEVINGPMIGIPVSIRDSDYFKEAGELRGNERSVIASIEWMATAWNATLADTGLWMGKTFEPVSHEIVAGKTDNDTEMMDIFDETSTRIGRNYFRQPPDPDTLQAIALPALTRLWKLKDRPLSPDTEGFDGELLVENLEKEQAIPYSKTGGYFLCNHGMSFVPEMNKKEVYQLNYRWPALGPTYPMTRLVDELVRIDDGIYLGQLIYATRHFSLGSFTLPGGQRLSLGEAYPHHSLLARVEHTLPIDLSGNENYYGYQNNGYFLMVDPAYARAFYADDAFPQLRPQPGEIAYRELGYDQATTASSDTGVQKDTDIMDWANDWKSDDTLKHKFTTLLLEDSPKGGEDDEVTGMLLESESVLQMLKRISGEISTQSNPRDELKHFEKLNRLFRRGVAPTVECGLFQGHGERGYNTRVNSDEVGDWYGEAVRSTGFDYYHGATLNLHCGFGETFCPDPDDRPDDDHIFPSKLSDILEVHRAPNMLNMMWHNIGKYIFPWAGKSYEKISGRKLSMFLDESDDLADRYPERVRELKTHLASAPHYALVKKNRNHHWDDNGSYARHLQNGTWDQGMSDEDKAFWENEAASHWVDGNNIQDKRIVAADPLMRIVDMNYRIPDDSLQAVSDAGPSPFARQGYIFLGVDERESILPMNNGDHKKTVFQFHYRFPMIGGPAPIGLCLDEIVEIADGLYLGQLIYSTALNVPFHSSVDSTEYKYQLFGYFLLLDDVWQKHRLAIGLDTIH